MHFRVAFIMQSVGMFVAERHGGTLRGLTARLPYLKELGITVIWLAPFQVSISANRNVAPRGKE